MRNDGPAPPRLQPRFPCVDFVSRFEYEALGTRGRPEQGAPAGVAPIRAGTCAPCLRPCVFSPSSPGRAAMADNLRCDCEDRLDSTERALVHFLLDRVGISAWTRLLHVGAPPHLAARLGSMIPAARTPVDQTDAHVVVAPWLAPEDARFAALASMLVPGGTLVFTTCFDREAAGTIAVAGRPTTFGWDVLERLRDAGLRHGAAHFYRSDELGYPADGDFIFSAQR